VIVLKESEMGRGDRNLDGNSFLAVTVKSPSSEKKKEVPSPPPKEKKSEEREPGSCLADLQDDLEVLEIGDNLEGMRTKRSSSALDERTNGELESPVS
jgi:hypothetical protein